MGLRVSIGLAILWFVLALLNVVWSGADTLTYYTVDLDHPYQGAAPGIGGAYLYSPAFAQAIALIRTRGSVGVLHRPRGRLPSWPGWCGWPGRSGSCSRRG